MTHTNAELMAHAHELADQMRELLPEPAAEVAEPAASASGAGHGLFDPLGADLVDDVRG